jgi:hypothetical protein
MSKSWDQMTVDEKLDELQNFIAHSNSNVMRNGTVPCTK